MHSFRAHNDNISALSSSSPLRQRNRSGAFFFKGCIEQSIRRGLWVGGGAYNWLQLSTCARFICFCTRLEFPKLRRVDKHHDGARVHTHIHTHTHTHKHHEGAHTHTSQARHKHRVSNTAKGKMCAQELAVAFNNSCATESFVSLQSQWLIKTDETREGEERREGKMLDIPRISQIQWVWCIRNMRGIDIKRKHLGHYEFQHKHTCIVGAALTRIMT